MLRRNGGPGIVPGGVRPHKEKPLNVARELALESDCLRRFYDEAGGDDWVEHNSWQKLLVQIRNPDGSPMDIDTISNIPPTNINHYRDELHGLRAKWVDKRKLPPNLTRVVELHMPNNNLVGHMPDCLSELIHLRNINLSENRLDGPIPAFLGSTLFELRHLDLSYNRLSGKVPPFGMRRINPLKSVRLHDNRIGGSLNLLLGNCTELQALALHNNAIRGELPESMTNLRRLEEITLDNNKLVGPIPEDLGRFMPGLKYLSISQNRFTGEVPVEALACCTNLQICNLGGCRFDFDGDQGTRDQVLNYLKGRLLDRALVYL